jgi:hypothetical protein
VSDEVVWVADWELQCCGDDFAVGDAVQWRLSPLEGGRAGYFDDDPVRATSFYDHHSEKPAPLRRGRVRSIQAVSYGVPATRPDA